MTTKKLSLSMFIGLTREDKEIISFKNYLKKW